MQKAWVLVLISALGGATFFLAGASDNPGNTLTRDINPHTMAAFRDGLYQAQLQARRGEQPRLSTGRWQQARDQALFVAGYRRGYAEFHAAHPVLKERRRTLDIERAQFGQPRSGGHGASRI